MVYVRVVFPPCSTKTSVPRASPGYHASSNFSVLTIRSGHDFAVHATHPHLGPVPIVLPHVAVLAAHAQVDLAHRHGPAGRSQQPAPDERRLRMGVEHQLAGSGEDA